MRKLVLILVRFYQLCISPVMPAHCIHTPTCSQYAIEAVESHGVLRGVWLAVKRLLRCHPFSKGGYDPVPEVAHHKCLNSLREK
ncbi:hypothetical protein MMIC_P2021 [Mariprofundus micogutta]|uniref:Putative membrane protein insertion efficiency factor n=1 Tax=Mariprofundus micogutta TaxID=1921010 RepID=A0A1L8CQ39_9PROT|nr:membrane protein insertion efficiency factor YidD [Mariprofundus micogutta]GAV21042.1 hypothetical protein MMIC_P2021 [Mariprofundus micogutta]